MLRYMRARKVAYDTQRQVRAYLEFVWYEQNYRDITAENRIIAKLPKELRKELYKCDFRRYFVGIELFGRLPEEIFAEALQEVRQTMLAKYHTISEVPRYPFSRFRTMNLTCSLLKEVKSTYFTSTTRHHHDATSRSLTYTEYSTPRTS